ncbi:MAG: prepilin-type N-terminal cleavage/methylation domain-containing protein, partial [Candidatus Saccharimonadales bacterium]
MFKGQKGFSIIELVIVMVILGVVGFAGWKVLGKKDPSTPRASSSQQSGGACPAQPMMTSPADVSLATAVLYPGQTRGSDYKPHGGLRFDNAKGNKVTVRAPMDAKL